MFGILRKVFGTKNERELKRLSPLVDLVTSLEPEVRALSDADLAAKTGEFKQRLENGEPLDDILPEAFAVVRETAARVLGERPYDVQVLGGIVLHQGRIAEMKTGEGKTLAATMPVYLNALTGKGAHVVTVNDYLAKRDAQWMGGIYGFLGLSVGVILPQLSDRERQIAYGSDITYGTNNEFGFDYLRDNMKYALEDLVQRELNYAIVDEVDSILIDEARTPLIISGPVEHSTVKDFAKLRPQLSGLFRKQRTMVNSLLQDVKRCLDQGDGEEAGVKLLMAYRGGPKEKSFLELMEDPAVRRLLKETEEEFSLAKRMPEIDETLYFAVEEKERNAYPTEKGKDLISGKDPRFFHVPDIYYELHVLDNDESLSAEEREEQKNRIKHEYEEKVNRNHVINQLLKAYALFEKDVEYVVKDGQIIIVDEFTGRLLPGRRYSDGLHQALEAKEGVQVEKENQTLATITFQNYFRMYDKLAGMTGTADTEAAEFKEIYNLDVVIMPTNREMIRGDHSDVIYKTEREKMAAAVDEIEHLHKEGRPVLVGTVSIDKSERIAKMLKKANIPHSVLNAKHHEKEAQIILHAGEAGTVTIATNMAGRGTDIKLGPGVVDVGGLHILGTERHESRRIDNQLRGRSGRQGDPGSSRFYLSLEDDLMRIFAAERIAGLMDRVGMEDGEPIEHGLVTKAIESAQRRVEGHNFNIRKQLLEYDTVMNQHREVIYEQRKMALGGEGLRDAVLGMMEDLADDLVFSYVPEKTFIEEWDLRAITEEMFRYFTVTVELDPEKSPDLTPEGLREYLLKKAMDAYRMKERELTEEVMDELMKWVTLRVVDEKWREHLVAMEHLREGIGLRGYGQKDPLVEYKKEGHALFQEMIHDIKKESVALLFRLQVVTEREVERLAPQEEPMTLSHGDPGSQTVKGTKKVGRNAPCPCGSGKKYKKCCGG